MSMVDNYSGTPAGYTTPEQIQQLRDYSALLTKGGVRDEPITNFWQGPRMMADALAGGLTRNKAGQQGLLNKNIEADTGMKIQPFMAPPPDAQTSGPVAPAPPVAPPAPVAQAAPAPPAPHRPFMGLAPNSAGTLATPDPIAGLMAPTGIGMA